MADQWFYTYADLLDLEKIKEMTEKEQNIDNLWKAFFNSVSIKERENKGLQRNNLPLRFRGNMPEFR